MFAMLLDSDAWEIPIAAENSFWDISSRSITWRILSFIVSFSSKFFGSIEGIFLCLAVQSKEKDFIPPNFRIKILIISLQIVFFFKVRNSEFTLLNVYISEHSFKRFHFLNSKVSTLNISRKILVTRALSY